jgi:hypothetical protein
MSCGRAQVKTEPALIRRATLPNDELKKIVRGLIAGGSAELEKAGADSTLPDAPSSRDAINDLLVRIRLAKPRVLHPLNL